MTLAPLSGKERLGLEPTPKWVRAMHDGKVVADSRRAMIVRGRSPPPRTYAFPPEDVSDAQEEARIEVDGHVALQWGAMDHWYEEAEEVFVHPRDPHKRIDVLRSGRRVEVSLEGERLARSDRPTLLFETGLPVRTYLQHDDIDMGRLRPSGTTTACPYKGWARHYDVKSGGTWHKDLAWTYLAPLREVDPIGGLIAFYDEKVDVDGKARPRPRTGFS